jgi:hypothetical protein
MTRRSGWCETDRSASSFAVSISITGPYQVCEVSSFLVHNSAAGLNIRRFRTRNKVANWRPCVMSTGSRGSREDYRPIFPAPTLILKDRLPRTCQHCIFCLTKESFLLE